MTNESVRANERAIEQASENVRPFIPRRQVGRSANGSAVDGWAVSKDRASVHGGDDPGPTAA
jgi:hypothetical protein